MAAKREPKQNVLGHRPAEGLLSESLNHFDGAQWLNDLKLVPALNLEL